MYLRARELTEAVRTLIEARTGDAVYVVGPDFTIVHWDETMESLSGVLAHRGGRRWQDYDRPARIGALQSHFLPLSDSSPRDPSPKSYPLIFLNACGASKLIPSGVTSFPELFLSIENRGVVGSETSIPDQFAAAFSQQCSMALAGPPRSYENELLLSLFSHQFYKRLLDERDSLGEAIYRARWGLMRRYNNPLGILYAVHANPDLRVGEGEDDRHGGVAE